MYGYRVGSGGVVLLSIVGDGIEEEEEWFDVWG